VRLEVCSAQDLNIDGLTTELSAIRVVLRLSLEEKYQVKCLVSRE
jgi:hypothetical protein